MLRILWGGTRFSGNGSTWSSLNWSDDEDEDEDFGILADFAPVPEGVTRVRVRFEGELREVEVENGYYLFVVWKTRCPDWGTGPIPVEYLREGRWEEPPDFAEQIEFRAEAARRFKELESRGFPEGYEGAYDEIR